MTAQRKFPIPYDYFKAIVALFLLLLIIWAYRNTGPTPTMDVAVDPSGVVTFSGEAKPGSIANLTLRNPDGSLEKMSSQTDDAGRWLISKRLAPGNYETLVDIAGKKSQIQGFEVPESASLSEISLRQSNSDPYLISGQATPGKELVLFLDGTETDRILVNPDGSWRYRIKAPPGNHTIQLAYADAPGITSPTINLDLPSRAPANAIIEKALIENGALHVSGHATPGATVYIWADGKLLTTVTADQKGDWDVLLNLSSGEHKIWVSNSEDDVSSENQLLITVPNADNDKSGFAYIVKEGDWLTKLARDYLGSEDRYIDIRKATNSKASVDSSFSTIEDDNLIYPGEKIWIPAK